MLPSGVAKEKNMSANNPTPVSPVKGKHSFASIFPFFHLAGTGQLRSGWEVRGGPVCFDVAVTHRQPFPQLS